MRLHTPYILAGLVLFSVAAPAKAQVDSLQLPVTRVQLGEVVSGTLTNDSAILQRNDESRPATVLAFPPIFPGEMYYFAIKSTRGEIRARLLEEVSEPGKPMKLREMVLMKKRFRAGEKFGTGAAQFSGTRPIRIELRSSGPERDAAFEVGLMLYQNWDKWRLEQAAMSALFEQNPARAINTRADRPADTTPWSDKAPLPAIEASTAVPLPAGFLETKAAALQPFYRALYEGGEHSAVLNFERLGLAALELDLRKDAEWAFDQALDRIEAIYANNPVAKAARSRYTLEAVKEFKGEPYERAMAYYYRGLLFLMADDYDNARAAFRSAEYQDTVSEAEEFAGDFGMMHFLAGWSARCAGQEATAADDFKAAAAIDPALGAPPAGHDFLVLGEIGRPPVKTKRGRSKEALIFGRSEDQGLDERAEVRPMRATDGQHAGRNAPPVSIEFANAADLHLQATTRGGRPIDALLRGKAVAKENLQEAADIIGSSMEFGLLGLIPQLLSDKVKADTDVRMWDTLPDRVVLATAPARHAEGMELRFTGRDGPIEATPTVRHAAGRCAMAWSRSRSASKVQAGVPGHNQKSIAARVKSPDGAARDRQFREWLGTL
ncbi:MAG TPA: hypothetical protein VN034_07930 [Sphingopyxis sp.]|nr:hypothetical protein [Sphingopyxis sp.]